MLSKEAVTKIDPKHSNVLHKIIFEYLVSTRQLFFEYLVNKGQSLMYKGHIKVPYE